MQFFLVRASLFVCYQGFVVPRLLIRLVALVCAISSFITLVFCFTIRFVLSSIGLFIQFVWLFSGWVSLLVRFLGGGW